MMNTTQPTSPPKAFGDGRSSTNAMRDARAWLEQSEGAIFTVCTNTMMDHGKVYRCALTGGRAIASSVTQWWAMSYGKPEEMQNVDLGEVVAVQISGSTLATLGVRNNRGFVYLRLGSG